MDSIIWELEQEDKEELIQKARLRYDSWQELASGIDLHQDNLRDHRKGRADGLTLGKAGELLTKTETESRFSNTELEELVDEEIPRGMYGSQEPRVRLPEGMAESIFKAFTMDQLDENFLWSRSTLNKFRNGSSKTYPRKLVETGLNDLNEQLDEEYDAEADLTVIGEGGTIIEDATADDILEIHRLRQQVQEYGSDRYSIFKDNIDSFDKIIDAEISVTPDDSSSEETMFREVAMFRELERLGLMKKHENLDSYTLKAENIYFEVLKRDVRKDVPETSESVPEYTREELVYALNFYEEKAGCAPKQSYFDCKDNHFPVSGTYRKHFGTWNYALWCAGLETDEKQYSEHELFTSLYDLTDQLGRRPSRKEFIEHPDTPGKSPIESRFGTYDSFTEEAGVYELAEPDIDWLIDYTTISSPEPVQPSASDD